MAHCPTCGQEVPNLTELDVNADEQELNVLPLKEGGNRVVYDVVLTATVGGEYREDGERLMEDQCENFVQILERTIRGTQGEVDVGSDRDVGGEFEEWEIWASVRLSGKTDLYERDVRQAVQNAARKLGWKYHS